MPLKIAKIVIPEKNKSKHVILCDSISAYDLI